MHSVRTFMLASNLRLALSLKVDMFPLSDPFLLQQCGGWCVMSGWW